jgi:hypothetical protein
MKKEQPRYSSKLQKKRIDALKYCMDAGSQVKR